MTSEEKTVIWLCDSCGVKNRVRVDRLEQDPKCGGCKESLSFDVPQHVNTKNFDQVVLESGLPVLVDFWAPWCAPCRMIAPVLEEMAKKFEGRLLIIKANTDEESTLGGRYQIRGIPALLLFKDGELKDQLAGALPAPQLEKWLSERL